MRGAARGAERPVVSIFGKTWDLHVHRALGITEEENLVLISETVQLPEGARQAKSSTTPSISSTATPPIPITRCETLEAAKNAGADVLCLCDTNGGTHAERLAEIVAEVRKRFDGVLGIHAHNDSDVAVANTLAAVEAGRHARAGLHERLWRALRQCQSVLDHRQPGTEAGPHHDRRARSCRDLTAVAASSPSWRTCRCATTSRSSATARSRTRAACTSAPC